MLKINFYPESDLMNFSSAVTEYKNIWEKEGENIVSKLENITGLKFKETEINAVVADLRSNSHPLTLRHNLDERRKAAVLVHELGHRILYKTAPVVGLVSSLDNHKVLFLALYDVFLDLWGEQVLQAEIKWGKDLGIKHGKYEYGQSWDWVMGFKTKEERQKKLKEFLVGEVRF